jgi:hypothetical protein
MPIRTADLIFYQLSDICPGNNAFNAGIVGQSITKNMQLNIAGRIG